MSLGIIPSMFGGAAGTAIKAVLDALTRDLSDDVVSLFLYGSLSSGTYQEGQSDVNLLIVLKEYVTIHQIRNILRPVWLKHMEVLKSTPLITTPETLKRHLDFNPGLGHHLVQFGTLLTGLPWLPEITSYDMVEHLSWMTRSAMHASAAIAPSLLSNWEISESMSSLRSMTRKLFGLNVDEHQQAPVLLSQIQADILRRMEQHPSLYWQDKRVPDPPPLINDLRSIYEYENRLVLVLPELGPKYISERLTQIDWDAVADRIIGQYRGLWVTTAAQLRLILQYDSAADCQLQTYNHAWGLDPVADLPVEPKQVFRSFGRVPSKLLVDALPHAYITSNDSDLSMLVHDLQNKLLNVQLQNELYCRVRNWVIRKPPKPLPDRDHPMDIRIDGIHNHLDWWSEYYHAHMIKIQSKAN